MTRTIFIIPILAIGSLTLGCGVQDTSALSDHRASDGPTIQLQFQNVPVELTAHRAPFQPIMVVAMDQDSQLTSITDDVRLTLHHENGDEVPYLSGLLPDLTRGGLAIYRELNVTVAGGPFHLKAKLGRGPETSSESFQVLLPAENQALFLDRENKEE